MKMKWRCPVCGHRKLNHLYATETDWAETMCEHCGILLEWGPFNISDTDMRFMRRQYWIIRPLTFPFRVIQSWWHNLQAKFDDDIPF